MAEYVSWIDQLTHRLLHQKVGLVGLHAEDVTSGPFGANTGGGDYVFPGNVTITGKLRSIGAANPSRSYFWDGLELGHPSSTPYIDFHRNANPEEATDYNIRLINESNGYLVMYGGWFKSPGGFDTNGTTLLGTAGRNWFKDTEVSAGSGLRVGGAWGYYGIYAESGDVVVGAASGINRFQSGTIIFDCANYIYTWGGSAGWDIGGGVRHKFWNDGEAWHNSIGLNGDNGYNAGLVITGGGWIRHMTADIGWHNEARGAGMMGASTFGNQTCTTNNNETTIIARKISQGGWATAGLSSFGESTSMVPYISMHANGCCTTNWRKDSGASYVVDVNSGGGCDWVYAANHPICSERARKRNISVAEEYGLKTIRLLKPHKFQYTPTSEDEIWQWEKWKYDRSIGVWTHPPSEHMGWDDWHVGYFAEEMVNLVPEIVGLHPDGTPKGIDYGNLVVVAIAAINELADRVEDLEARMYATA